MIGKLLLTAAVIAIAYLFVRVRGRRPLPLPRVSERARPNPNPWRVAAWTFAAVLGAGSLVFWLLDWQQSERIVTVRVINANSGEIATYRAAEDSVTGRTFRTLDGRVVTLADVERMELIVAD